MPKQKTHKGVAKRFKLSARGKVLHPKAGKGKSLSQKSARRKRRLRDGVTTGAQAALIRKALGKG